MSSRPNVLEYSNWTACLYMFYLFGGSMMSENVQNRTRSQAIIARRFRNN
ncbi:16174_t:CDS:2 [Funneliformis mosseae]|uniref:16174_t:CDS:1 n=1 Tax=Funneliformis mosseae TaxID=27381 RepID=A0A9N9F0K1_FUNMO|nr:16174_t:CDS:2 [Funneliformis mosseae]